MDVADDSFGGEGVSADGIGVVDELRHALEEEGCCEDGAGVFGID